MIESNDNNSFKEKNRSKTWITEGIMIAITPVIVYGLALTYETSYAKFFHIPNGLIEVNMMTIYIVLGSLASVIMTLLIMYNTIPILLEDIDNNIAAKIIGIIFLLALYIGIFNMYGAVYWRKTIWCGISLILLLMLYFVLPLITQRNVKGYTNKLKAQDNIDTTHYFLDHLALKYGREIFIVFATLFFLFVMARVAGETAALKQKEYMVTSSSPEMIVARIYGDHMICFPFDRETKTIDNKLFIINVPPENNAYFMFEAVGPLKMSK